MNRFKLIVAISCVAGLAHAQTVPGSPGTAAAQGPDFAAHKSRLLASIDARAAALGTLRSCVAVAADHAAVHVCEEQHRTTLASLRSRR